MKCLFSLLMSVAMLGSSCVFAEDTSKAKSEARKEVDQALDTIEKQIGAMETKSKEMSKEARVEWQKAIDDLKKTGAKLREEIKEERSAGESKAKDYWARMKAAVGELSAGVESAARKLKDKAETKK